MLRHPLCASPVLLLAIQTTPALAQASGTTNDEQIIVITGRREAPGVTPVRQLGQQDIEAYGANSVGELIDEIAAESGRPGNTAFLVNGRRISDLSELSDYPAEVLERVDVLGGGAGTAVGQPATRRVYNLVLRKRFDGRIGRAASGIATEGGWSTRRADISYTRIRNQRRLNLRLGVRDEDDLLESDRDLVQPVSSVPNAGRFRTLRPELLSFDVSTSAAMPLADWLDLSTAGKLSLVRSDALLGFSDALNRGREQERRNASGRLNATLNGQRAGWDLTLLGRFEQNQSRVLLDGTQTMIGRERTSGTSRSFELDFTGSRQLFDLPAGRLQLTLGANLAGDRTTSRPRRNGAGVRSTINEHTRTLSGGLTVPIASRAGSFLPQLGELNASFNFGATQFSDAGSESNRQLSLTWQPSPVVRAFGVLSRSSAPPPASSRGDPFLETPGQLYFDPLRNETIEVTEISGGVVAARARQRSSQRQLGLALSPPGPLNLGVSVDYDDRRDRNLLAALPQASPTILTLFPGRFLRDASGRLTTVDVRPVLFVGRTERELRSAVNFSVPLSRRGQTAADGDGGDRQRGEEGESATSNARMQINLAHTYLISSKVDVGGGRSIDLLSRRAIAFGGGRMRHQFDGSLGIGVRGLGLRLTASHRSRSLIEMGGQEGSRNILRFGRLTLVNLRAFANAERLFGQRTWTHGGRMTLSVSNLTNARQQVRDDFGTTPLAFQPAYRDPTGRTIELEFRKRL